MNYFAMNYFAISKGGTKNDCFIKVNLRLLKVDINCQYISLKRTLEAIDVCK